MNDNIDDALLISLIEQYTHLYDKKSQEYKNKLSRQNAWKSIAGVIGSTAENCEQRFSVLRNRFATEKRKIKNMPSGSGSYSTWPLFDSMSFLEQFVVPRKTFSNVKKKNTPSFSASEPSDLNDLKETEEHPHQEEDSMEIIELEDFVFSNNEEPKVECIPQLPMPNSEEVLGEEQDKTEKPSTSKQVIIRKHPHKHLVATRKLRNDITNHPKTINQKLENTIQGAFESLNTLISNTSNNDTEDDCSYFGKSVTHSLKQIKNKQKRYELKLKILQILSEYDTDQD